MPRIEQEPTESEGHHGGVRYDHPAYGQIGASRVSGARNLYGSDFSHQHYISVHISRSCFERGLSTDWHHAKDEIVRVDLSEAQWATFVSAMNVGSGTPCTISRIGREGVPEIPSRQQAAHFKNEAREKVARNIDRLKALRAKVLDAASSLAKAKQADLLAEIDGAIQDLGQNLPFVADCFDEHVEATIEKAKVEVHGYIQGVLTRAGIQALSSESRDPLLIEGKRSDDDAAR